MEHSSGCFEVSFSIRKELKEKCMKENISTWEELNIFLGRIYLSFPAIRNKSIFFKP